MIMVNLWFTVPSSRHLQGFLNTLNIHETITTVQNVQALVSTIVSLLSLGASFIVIELFWLRQAARIGRGTSVPLRELLNVSSPAEVLSLGWLLRASIFNSRYGTLLVQCAIVLTFSLISLTSGFFASFSVRSNSEIVSQNINGSLASHHWTSMAFGSVQWDTVYKRLDKADFPSDELLDFLPYDGPTDWAYQTSQWNNTFRLDCDSTDLTTVRLVTSSNCSDSQDLMYQLSGFEQVLDPSSWQSVQYSFEYSTNSTNVNFGMALLYDATNLQYNETASTTQLTSMKLTIALLYVPSISRPSDPEFDFCYFDPGSSVQMKFTKIQCNVTQQAFPSQSYYTAFPDGTFQDVNQGIPGAYIDYYYSNFSQQATQNEPIVYLTPSQLTRFYQSYLIASNTQTEFSVTRPISVRIPVVQVSKIFMLVAAIVAVFINLGVLSCLWVTHRNKNDMASTPQSKLDWAIQSIEGSGRARRSVTVGSIATLHGLSNSKQRVAEFETARYGSRITGQSLIPTGSSEYNSSSAMLAQGGMNISDREPQGIERPWARLNNFEMNPLSFNRGQYSRIED